MTNLKGYPQENFRKRLATGQQTEQHVAQILKQKGVQIEVPDFEFHEDSFEEIERRGRLQKDLIANGKILEVKGRNFSFKDVGSYPYLDQFVESVSGFDKKEEKPAYYLNVSNPTGAIIALDVKKTFNQWKSRQITDRERGISYYMYVADTVLWMDLDQLIEELCQNPKSQTQN